MKNQVLNILKLVKDYAIPLTGIIFAILNIYLTLKLSPIIYDIKTLGSRVDAVEQTSAAGHIELEDSLKATNQNIRDVLKDINNKLDKISDATNTINGRVSRIEGKLEAN